MIHANHPTIAEAARAKRMGPTARPREPSASRLKTPPDPLAVHYTLLALYALACALGALAGSCLLWNWTPSLPLGLYGKLPASSARRGDFVVFRVRGPLRSLLHERGYLPDGSVLMKPVVAEAGDEVCTRADVLAINGRVFGAVLTADREGRALPTDHFCGVLPPGQVYVASSVQGSFDSRNFGPVDTHAIQARAVPLWTY